jgi:YjbE family integral membrane protein
MILASSGGLWALTQVVLINLVLSGDNAMAIGMAAAGLPAGLRNKAILIGIVAATALRLGFAFIAVQLLGVPGLPLVGGILLLWVCWKMWEELQSHKLVSNDCLGTRADTGAVEDGIPHNEAKTFGAAILQIVVADVSMSLDNVLAVAGAASEHMGVLMFGLVLSIALMGVAASIVSRLLNRYRWTASLGLGIILLVAIQLIYRGAIETMATLA